MASAGPYAATLPLLNTYSPITGSSNTFILFKVSPFYLTSQTVPYSSPMMNSPLVESLSTRGQLTGISSYLTRVCC